MSQLRRIETETNGFNSFKRDRTHAKWFNTCNKSRHMQNVNSLQKDFTTVLKSEHMQKDQTHAGTHAKCQQFPKISNTCKRSNTFQFKFVGHKVSIDKSKNTGWTSVDRSTRATLSTYNTWIQIGRLRKIHQSCGINFNSNPQLYQLWTFHRSRANPNSCHVSAILVDNTA